MIFYEIRYLCLIHLKVTIFELWSGVIILVVCLFNTFQRNQEPAILTLSVVSN